MAAGAGAASSAAQQLEKPAPLLINWEAASAAKESDFQQRLESKDEDVKISALEQIVALLANGEMGQKVFMQVIKFCLNTDNHTIKKLLLSFFELVEKRSKDGHFLPEMILVCNALKNNLTHPNEYVRGSTLRFLCKIKEVEILESLIPSVTANLEHRHSYVRKYAVSTVCTIHKSFPELIPDAPALIERFLDLEFNLAAKRNAFQALYQIAPDKAVNYLNGVIEQVPAMDESFQLVVLELIRKVCRANPLVKSQYAKCVFNLLTKSSNAVAYEGANTLCALFPSPTAVRAAVAAYTRLLQAESDNNVKLIILGRLAALKKRNEKVLQEMLMDILRALSAPNIEVRRRTLDLAVELLSPRNVDEVVGLLRKEIQKSESPEQGKSDDYRKLLVDTLHQCAVRFPEVVQSVVLILMNYLGDENAAAGLDVIHFVREIVEESAALRDSIVQKLLESFDDIRTPEVCRVAFWILGEYATEAEVLNLAMLTIRTSVGPLPLLPAQKEEDAAAAAAAAAVPEVKAAAPTPKSAGAAGSGSAGDRKGGANTTAVSATPKAAASRPVILADGTYGSQSAIAATVAAAAAVDDKKDDRKNGAANGRDSHLRTLLLKGDYYLAACLANAFTKLLLRYNKLTGYGKNEASEEMAKGMHLFVNLLQLGDSKRAPKSLDADSRLRIVNCIRVLMEPKGNEELFFGTGRAVFSALLEEQRRKNPKSIIGKQPKPGAPAAAAAAAAGAAGAMQLPKAAGADAKDVKEGGAEGEGDAKEKKKVEVVKHADDLISIRQLTGQPADGVEAGEDDSADVTRAVGAKKSAGALTDASRTKLNRVHQLSGFADPVYVEAHLTVHEYDIVLDVLIVNQTKNILQNFALELNTSADLKVVDRPQPFAVPAFGVSRCSVNIKVHSTESGVIFGSASYDSAVAGTQKTLVVLNNIQMDIMDYIHPATVGDMRFRAMWAEFEWENKVAVNTDYTDLNEYLTNLLAITNMRNLTAQVTHGYTHCNFMACNLYARSIFGEDALLNLNIEKSVATSKIEGYIRIRSKTQGIALSLGDKINAKQRGPHRPNPAVIAARLAAEQAQAAAQSAAAAILDGKPVPAPAAAGAGANTTAVAASPRR